MDRPGIDHVLSQTRLLTALARSLTLPKLHLATLHANIVHENTYKIPLMSLRANVFHVPLQNILLFSLFFQSWTKCHSCCQSHKRTLESQLSSQELKLVVSLWTRGETSNRWLNILTLRLPLYLKIKLYLNGHIYAAKLKNTYMLILKVTLPILRTASLLNYSGSTAKTLLHTHGE